MHTTPRAPATIILDPAERTRCEVWSRSMGYHRPVSFWNPGKQQEHRDRRYFRETPELSTAPGVRANAR